MFFRSALFHPHVLLWQRHVFDAGKANDWLVQRAADKDFDSRQVWKSTVLWNELFSYVCPSWICLLSSWISWIIRFCLWRYHFCILVYISLTETQCITNCHVIKENVMLAFETQKDVLSGKYIWHVFSASEC